MTAPVDPLERLLVDHSDVDRELLAATLHDIVRVDREAARYSFMPGVRAQFDTRRTVLASLLARKALALLSPGYAEACPPRILEEETGIPGGSLRPALKVLAGQRLVARTADGYVIPNYALEHAARGLATNAR